MHKELIRSMEGVDMYGVIALLIFLVVFLVWLFLTLSIRPEHADEMGRLPLDEGNQEREEDRKNV